MRCLRIIALLMAAGLAQAQDVPFPAIGSIGEEEFISGQYMERPSVAADSKGQPHMVCDFGGNTQFMKFHRIGDQWSGGVFAVGSRGGRYDASRLYIGQIEIDSRDRAWISCKFGVKEYGAMYGQGIWLFKNMDTVPKEQFFRFVCVYKGMGVITTDAKYPDQGVVIGTFGNYAVLHASGQTLSTGSLNAGPGGEKVRARIASYAPRYDSEPGRDYADGVWHTAMNGYSVASSRYQNSLRYKSGFGPVEWAAYSAYPQQGSDFSHPGVGIDLVNPLICYIGSVFNGQLCVNIWDGGRMLFPSTNLKVLDYSAMYEIRHGPAFVPAPSGGTFIFWTSGGRIKEAYLSPDGESTDPVDITSGRSPAAAMDRFGNIHLVYSSNGPRYRKLTLSELNPQAPMGRVSDTRTPVFSWTGTEAPAYTIALSRDGSLLRTVSVATNSWTPESPLEAGVYSWIVKEGEADSDEMWSRPLAFSLPPAVPVPVAPAGRIAGADADAALFTWTGADSAANKVKVELYKGVDLLGSRSTGESGSLTWPDPLEPGAYAWRAKAFRSVTNFAISSEWSPLQRFQVEVPGSCAILTPASMEAFSPGPFTAACSWTPADGAESYTLTVLHNGSLLATIPDIRATSYDLVLKGQPGYLTLIVQPYNTAGQGDPSPARTFLVNRNMTPSGGSLVSDPGTFSWTRSKPVTRYLFKLSRYSEATGKYVVVEQSWVTPAKSNPVTWRSAYAFSAGAYRWAVTDYNGTLAGFTSTATFSFRDLP
jgi:hypothetical protein